MILPKSARRSGIGFGSIFSLAQLLKTAKAWTSELTTDGEPRFAYRGQAQAFGTLIPSISRGFPENTSESARAIERRLMRKFRQGLSELHHGHALSIDHPDRLAQGNELACLSVMQHHEIPTRLLDWTTNPWVAAYFACSTQLDQEAELWIYHRKVLQEIKLTLPDKVISVDLTGVSALPEVLNSDARSLVEFRPNNSERMRAQAGHHTLSSEILLDHVTLFCDIRDEAQRVLDRNLGMVLRHVTIASHCKSAILDYLDDAFNIRTNRIYPDLAGLSGYLRADFRSQFDLHLREKREG